MSIIQKMAILFVFLAVTALSASFLHHRPIYASDTLVYLDGAASLAAGEGYRTGGQMHTAWPPGYSFVLSFFYRAGMDSIFAFKVLNILFATASLLGFWLVLRHLPVPFPSLVVLLTGVYFPWIYNIHFVGSDMLFCLVVCLFLYGAVRTMQTHDKTGLILAAVAVAIAPMVRMAGVALFIPWLVLLSLRLLSAFFSPLSVLCRPPSAHRPISAFCFLLSVFLTSLLPLVLWAWRNYAITGTWTSVQTGVTPEYLASMRELGIEKVTLLSKLLVNIRGYAHILVIPDQSRGAALSRLPLVVSLGCIGASLLVLVGWLRSFQQREGIVPAITFAAYGGMLLTHNWYDIRYLLPVLPLYFAYLIEAFGWSLSVVFQRLPVVVVRTAARRYAQVCAAALLVVVIVANAGLSMISPPARRLRSSDYSGAVQHLYEACQFLRQAGAHRVLISSVGFAKQWTGAEMLPVLGLLDENRNLTRLELPRDVDYLIQQKESFVDYDSLYIDPLVKENVARLQVVYSNASVNVYAVHP